MRASQVCNLRIFNQWKGRILLDKDREGVVRGKHGTMSIQLNGDLIQNDFSETMYHIFKGSASQLNKLVLKDSPHI